MKPSAGIIALSAAVIAVTAVIVTMVSKQRNRDQEEMKDHLTCILELDDIADSSAALVTGYQYHLLRRFAADRGGSIDISLSPEGFSGRDSLRAGLVDIIVAPLQDSTGRDGLLSSRPIDSLCVWLACHNDRRLMKEIEDWLEDWYGSEEYPATRDMFLVNFNPYRNTRRNYMSPYDSLMKSHADSTGTDWRLLAAVAYKESRFHIEAKSRRGASGLMQMMPHTAASHGFTDLLDPDRSISAGATYLKRLRSHYRKGAADPEELMKFSLAAYNAGIGRLDNCLLFAGRHGKDISRWEEVLEAMPEMKDSLAADSTAVFYKSALGNETVCYVETVTEIYHAFCRIYPE